MKKMAAVLTFFTLVMGLVVHVRGQIPTELIVYPELIIHNGKVVTVDDPTTSTNPGTIVEALAVRNGKILALGGNQEILALQGPQSQVIDLKGRTVVPGIIDTHSHLQSYAIAHYGWREIAKRQIAIRAKSDESWESVKRKALDRIKEAAAERQADEWIAVSLPREALDQNEKSMVAQQANAFGLLMTRAEVDEVAPNHPVYIAAGTSAVTNRRAQEILREIWYGPEEPQLMREDGVSSNTINRIMASDFLIPDLETLAQIYKQENFEWAGFGITTWASSLRSLRVLAGYQLLDKRGEIGIRLAYAPAAGTPLQVIPQMLGVGDYGSDYLWPIGSSRRGMDSSYPGLYTSLEPPTIRQEIKDRELVFMTPARAQAYSKFIEDSIASGQRFANSHTAGDQTLDMTLDAIEKGSSRAGLSLEEIRAKRHVIDHCTMNPRPDQIPRLKKLGIIMSCGPKYIEATSARILRDYGEEYLNWVVPVKSLIDAGVRTVLEIDTHGIAQEGSVFHYLDLLVNREVDGKFYAGKERIDRVQALKMGTIWAAEYVLRENVLGSLEKGKLADFIVLDKDYLTVENQHIRSIKVLLTVVGGNIVHQSESLGISDSS